MSPKGIVWKEGKTEFLTLEKREKKDEPGWELSGRQGNGDHMAKDTPREKSSCSQRSLSTQGSHDL